jgi:hypothetical protein
LLFACDYLVAFLDWPRFLVCALFFELALFLAADRFSDFLEAFFVWIFLVAPFFMETLLLLTTLGGPGVHVFSIFVTHFFMKFLVILNSPFFVSSTFCSTSFFNLTVKVAFTGF